MSKKWGTIQYADFENLQKRLEQLEKADMDAFCRNAAKELAARLLAKVKQRTPVGVYPKGSGQTGGTLRRNWTCDFNVEYRGNEYRITVYNPTEYAIYVEYGHRTRGGAGWVNGRFMMTESVNELEKQMPAIIERKLQKFIKDMLLNG